MESTDIPKNGTLVVMVGPPGCGKSTEAALMSMKFGCKVISTDGIREELYGDPATQGDPDEVFKIAFDRVKDSLQHTNVIFDATNCKREYRERVLDATYGYRRIAMAYVSAAPLSSCINNNAKRDRKVPEGVIRRMYDSLWDDPPTKSEGFDDVRWF